MEAKTLFKFASIPSCGRYVWNLRILIRCGNRVKIFGDFYDESAAIAALLDKLARINEAGLLDLVTSAEVVFDTPGEGAEGKKNEAV
jgi:hypothetical protein